MAELKLDAAPSYGRLSDSCFLWAARPDLADPRKGTFKSNPDPDPNPYPPPNPYPHPYPNPNPNLADPRKGTFKSKGPADKFKTAVLLASATLTLA